MSAKGAFFAAVGIYTPVYLMLAWSVPRKSGINYVSRLRVHYATSDWSFWSEWMQAISSLGTVALYVIDSYYLEPIYKAWATQTEVLFAVYFAFNFALELLLSKNRWAHIFSFLGLVDIVTTVPVLVGVTSEVYESSPSGFVRLYRILMLPRVFKPLRLLRAARTMSPNQDAVMEQTIMAMAYFVSTLFFASGLVQALSMGRTQEWGDVEVALMDSKPMAFHDALYFIIVTFSTVGYGDISPPDTPSRLVVVLMVGFFFFMIPRELNKLNQLLDLSSKYTVGARSLLDAVAQVVLGAALSPKRTSPSLGVTLCVRWGLSRNYKENGAYPKKLSGGHVIVGCDVASCSLVAAFLEEFFHEDHGYNAMHVVLLVPNEPTMEWKRLILKFAANDRVTYLKGDLRCTTDLARVYAHKASSCFIICNRYENLREEEKRGFMRAINVQDFNPSIHIFVEALSVGMRQRLIKVGINPSRIVCASTINTRMLANACAWEGASTLVNNLLMSTSINEQRGMPKWLKEYTFGLSKEIYVVSIDAFAGQGFSKLVVELFRQYGVVLLGISEDYRVVLHPGADFIINRGDLGFLVADDADVAESILEQARSMIPPKSPASTQRLAEVLAGSIRWAEKTHTGTGAGTTAGAASTHGSPLSGRGGAPQIPVLSKRSPHNMRDGDSPPHRSFSDDAICDEAKVSAREPGSGDDDSAAIVSDYDSSIAGGGSPSRLFSPTIRDAVDKSLSRNEQEAKPSLSFNRRLESPHPCPTSFFPCPETLQQLDPATYVSRKNRDGAKEQGARRRGSRAGEGDATRGHIVLVTPSLSEVSTLVEALEAPQVPEMAFVVVCPMYSWRQEQDEAEMRRLRRFSQVRVVSSAASKTALREVGASRARMVVLRSGKSFPEQGSSDADAEAIGQLVEVVAAAGPDVRVVVELNDMTYGNQYEILVDRLRSSSSLNRTSNWRTGSPKGSRANDTSISAARCPDSLESHRSWGRWGRFGSQACREPSVVESGGRGGLGIRKQGTILRSGLTITQGAWNIGRGSTGDSGGLGGSLSWERVRGNRSGVHWSLSKGFASGAIVPNNLPESLLCQAYYNPAIIMIVEALLDPKGCVHNKHSNRDDNEDAASDEYEGIGSSPESASEDDDGGTGESFLAQRMPPRRFFSEAMLMGYRPNFQELMSFMLREYDALPFGLLRYRKVVTPEPDSAEEIPMFVHCCPHPSQKVMPLDKVFLLVPSQQSWEHMQRESTSPVHSPTRPTAASFKEPQHKRRSSTDRLTRGRPPTRYAERDIHASRADTGQGVPEAAALDRSQSPAGRRVLHDRVGQRGHDNRSQLRVSSTRAGAGGRMARPEASDAINSRASRRGGQSRGEVASPSPDRESRPKLDRLLNEVQRVNSRLDKLVDRLIELENRGGEGKEI